MYREVFSSCTFYTYKTAAVEQWSFDLDLKRNIHHHITLFNDYKTNLKRPTDYNESLSNGTYKSTQNTERTLGVCTQRRIVNYTLHTANLLATHNS